MGLWQGIWRCLGMLRAIIATMELIWRFEQVYVKGCSYGFNSQCDSFIIVCIPLYPTLSKMELVFKDVETQTSNPKHTYIYFFASQKSLIAFAARFNNIHHRGISFQRKTQPISWRWCQIIHQLIHRHTNSFTILCWSADISSAPNEGRQIGSPRKLSNWSKDVM